MWGSPNGQSSRLARWGSWLWDRLSFLLLFIRAITGFDALSNMVITVRPAARRAAASRNEFMAVLRNRSAGVSFPRPGCHCKTFIIRNG